MGTMQRTWRGFLPLPINVRNHHLFVYIKKIDEERHL